MSKVESAQLRLVYRVLATGQPHSQLPGAPPDEARRLRMIRHHVRCLGRLGISAGPLLAQVSRAYKTRTRLEASPRRRKQ